MIELVQERRAKSAIKRRHRVHFATAEQIWDAVFGLIQGGQSLANCGAHFWTRWAVLAFHTKQLRSFRAALLLLEHGLVAEAQKIVRPMTESVIHLDFLIRQKDPAKTAHLYLLWEYANYERNALILRLDQKDSHQQSLLELARGLEEEKKRLGKDDWKKYVKCGPSLLTLDALARQQGLGELYDTVFRMTSGPIHSTNLHTYTRPSSDGKELNLFLGPSETHLQLTLESACAMLFETAVRVDEALRLGQGENLRKLSAEVHGEWQKIGDPA